MKRLVGAIVALACALTFCLAFVGCGPNVDKSLYVGEWELQSGSAEGLDADTIALTKSLGNNVTLRLSEDGTGALDLFGEVTSLAWTASSDEEGTVKLDDAKESVMKLEDGSLVLYDSGGGSLTFSRP